MNTIDPWSFPLTSSPIESALQAALLRFLELRRKALELWVAEYGVR